jgi:ubiquinone/menaquinone biosynthesis C-methylase UbiE
MRSTQSEESAGRLSWAQGAHERRVESFYTHGADRFGDCHGGYLNFGLWDQPGEPYLLAAERMISTLAGWSGIGSSSRLLDVGCGFGAQDIYLARNFSPLSITALDVTWPHVVAARARALQAGIGDGLRFLHGSGTDLRFPAGSFSHVMAVESVVHFDTRERFFQEAHRMLEPRGTLVLADYCMGRAPRGAQDRFFIDLSRRGWHVPAENCDTVEGYREKLARSGFARIEIERVGGRTIPQYFREQATLAHFGNIARIRGFPAAAVGLAIDAFLWLAWRRGILEYILVRARKASA